jgi:hypothetical protein
MGVVGAVVQDAEREAHVRWRVSGRGSVRSRAWTRGAAQVEDA